MFDRNNNMADKSQKWVLIHFGWIPATQSCIANLQRLIKKLTFPIRNHGTHRMPWKQIYKGRKLFEYLAKKGIPKPCI
jgi:hypothetical protein